MVKRSTRSYDEGSEEGPFGHNLTNFWTRDGKNQTWSQESLTSWNHTLIQALGEWNQTTTDEENEEDGVKEMERNFTEVNLHNWLNINYTDEDDGSRIIGGSFCRPGDCPWQVKRFFLKVLTK